MVEVEVAGSRRDVIKQFREAVHKSYRSVSDAFEAFCGDDGTRITRAGFMRGLWIRQSWVGGSVCRQVHFVESLRRADLCRCRR